MPKKFYPGGFRLTKKMAAALAVQELGTARGLEHEPNMPEGYFHITFGSLDVRIHPEATKSSRRSSSGLIQLGVDMGTRERIVRFFWPDTLEENFQEEEIYQRVERKEAMEEWIERDGPEKCHAEIDRLCRERGY